MDTPQLFFFPPFRLELDNEQLVRGMHVIELRPKTFAVLCYLLEHSGRLVTKEQMLDAVWYRTVVSESVLKNCIRELRQALGDTAHTPHYIETVHRRGYRFIAPVTTQSVVSTNKAGTTSPQLITGNWQLETRLVGREKEIAQLHRWLNTAFSGERQIVFVSGEPGIGKTTLVDAFLAQVRETENQKPVLSEVEGAKIQDLQSAIRNWKKPKRVFMAINIARHQGAKSLELRAVMSLGRLWKQQGQKKQARQMLAKIYGWFTEGFETADLQEAKALLRELGGR